MDDFWRDMLVARPRLSPHGLAAHTMLSTTPDATKSYAARLLTVLVALTFVVLTLTPAGSGQASSLRRAAQAVLVQPLENRFERPRSANLTGATGLIVLGGSDERVREAGRLARRWSHLRIFVSNHGPAEYVQRLLGDGIAFERVAIETRSQTTYDNAINSNRHIAPRPGERWLLVTSAVHMPRAMGAFRQVGFHTEPWPVHDLTGRLLNDLSAVSHEWLGLAWYRLLQRSSALFPAQATALREAAQTASK
jgi:uncharacterized SAM-binding protein YcdF (DUF218 family)